MTTKKTTKPKTAKKPAANLSAATAAPASVTIAFETKAKQRFFAGTSVGTNDAGATKRGMKAVREGLQALELTEADLLSRAAAATNYSVEQIVRTGAIERAKRLYATAVQGKPGPTSPGAADEKHAAAYAELEAEGKSNITPSMLYWRAKTNARSAERWLLRFGKTWQNKRGPGARATE